MSRLVRCDRCGATAPERTEGWEPLPDPDSPLDPILGGHDQSIDVCPACQTFEERPDILLRDVAEAVADDGV